jgi:hypothetical protein
MTRPFRTDQLKTNTVNDIQALWNAINFKPSYQRQSDIWEKSKRQLFIDSLINGYDIPKLYFHDLSWSSREPTKRYAIIDGKQRLEAINAFMKDEFELSDDFEDIEQESEDGTAAGLLYSELSAKRPDLKVRLDQAKLPIILVQTRGVGAQDLEVIEEMFSRLNEAVPLNAPEKRNALGGPLPKQIRRLARDGFFTSRLAFPNARYKHLDMATKFLYIEYKDGLTDLKKRSLDNFVKEFKAENLVGKAAELCEKSSQVLTKMSRVFKESDDLLASVGMVTIYYQLFREAIADRWLDEIERSALVEFDDLRSLNRSRVKEAQELALEQKRPSRALTINPVLTAFERYVQSPNDVTALKKRLAILRQYIRTGKVPSTEPSGE